MSTLAHHGGQEQIRFMEVDGVVREVHGDTGSVAVKGRDSRNSNMQVTETNNTNNDFGSDIWKGIRLCLIQREREWKIRRRKLKREIKRV